MLESILGSNLSSEVTTIYSNFGLEKRKGDIKENNQPKGQEEEVGKREEKRFKLEKGIERKISGSEKKDFSKVAKNSEKDLRVDRKREAEREKDRLKEVEREKERQRRKEEKDNALHFYKVVVKVSEEGDIGIEIFHINCFGKELTQQDWAVSGPNFIKMSQKDFSKYSYKSINLRVNERLYALVRNLVQHFGSKTLQVDSSNIRK